MKILHAQQYPFNPDIIPGGPFSAGYHLSHELAALPDVDLRVVTVTKEVESDLQRVDGRVPVTFLAQKRRRLIPNQITDINRVAQTIEEIKPDIVSAQLAVYGVAASKVDVPSAYLIHGVISREAKLQTSLKSRLVYGLHQRMDVAAAKAAKHIIATSAYVIPEYENITNAQFHVIDNAVDDRYFEVPQDSREPVRIFFAGLVYDRKNVLGAIEIIKRLKPKYPDIVLRIAGWIPDPAYHKQCLDLIEDNGLQNNVVFLGMTDKSQMLEELASCSLFLLTSKQETAPLVISEAMAAGVPIVTADVGGCAYMVADGESGFVVSWDDTEAFVDRVGLLLSDNEIRNRFSVRAREIAEARFRRRVVAAHTLSVYQEILSNWKR